MTARLVSAWLDVFGSAHYPDGQTLWSNASHLTSAGYRAFADLCVAAMSDPGTSNVVCLSDSWGAQGLAELTASLAARFPAATLVDASVSGNKLWQMLDRFDADVTPAGPHTVIHFSGCANDVYSGRARGLVADDVRELVAKCNAIGADVVIPGVAPMSEHRLTSEIDYHAVRAGVHRP